MLVNVNRDEMYTLITDVYETHCYPLTTGSQRT